MTVRCCAACIVLVGLVAESLVAALPSTTTHAVGRRELWPSSPAASSQAATIYRLGQEFRRGAKYAGEPKLSEEILTGIGPLAASECADARKWLVYWRDELDALQAIDFTSAFDWGPLPDKPLAVDRENAPLEIGSQLIIRLLVVDGSIAASEGDYSRALRRSSQLRDYGVAISRWPAWILGIAGGACQLHASRIEMRASRSPGFDICTTRNRDTSRSAILKLSSGGYASAMLQNRLNGDEVLYEDLREQVRQGRLDPTWAVKELRVPPTANLDQTVEDALQVIRAYRSAFAKEGAITFSAYLALREKRVLEPLARVSGASGFIPSYETALQSSYRVEAYQRAAALMIAIAIYRADHGGSWPGRLEDLVPNAIASVPVDPTRRDGTQIGYDPDKHTLGFGESKREVFELEPVVANQ